MKLKPFKFNLEQKVVPMAQSILVSNGRHSPTLLSYDKNGIEKVSDLSELFSLTDKEVMYKILQSYLTESDSVAFILISEAWCTSIHNNKDEDNAKEVLEGDVSISKLKNKEEVLSFQWDFRLGKVKQDGSISYMFENSGGNIVIDYDNPMITERGDGSKSYSKLGAVLAGDEEQRKDSGY